MLLRVQMSFSSNCYLGLVIPRSMTRLGLAFAMALDAYMGGVTLSDPLPWVSGLPFGAGIWMDFGIGAPVALGYRLATVFDSAEIVLLSSVSSAMSVL
jgi:hypothetical protein